MSKISKKLTTNARILKDVLTHYSSTFNAFKELINNSLQAHARNIYIELRASECDEDSVLYHKIETIKISDDGDGVPLSEFDESIMQIATEKKDGGMGVGRFGALQIGRVMTIETCAFDEKENKHTVTSVTFDADTIKSVNLDEQEFEVFATISEEKLKKGYDVTISNLYSNDCGKCKKKNKLNEDFELPNFKQLIFENYPFEIFEGKVSFYINGEKLKREDFFLETPKLKTVDYTDVDGNNLKVSLHFYKIKLNKKGVSIFLQIRNAGIFTTVAKYAYASPWYTTELGTWYIFVDSELMTEDLLANFSLASLGHKESRNFSKALREAVDEFFKEGNPKFVSFVEKLAGDSIYPYYGIPEEEQGLSKSLFDHAAYILEEDQKLEETHSAARKLIYPLLNKVIEDGNTEFLVEKVIGLSDKSKEKYRELLDITNIDQIVNFSSSVGKKLEFLDFLYEITYGDISKSLKERAQLHKIVEKELWLFGEEYGASTVLWSDTKLANNLDELHRKYLDYEPTDDDENLIAEYKEEYGDITDLFFYNERKLGNNRREVMIVELKAPYCKLSQKELNQVEKYAYKIEEMAAFPKANTTYKIILISSDATKIAKSLLKSGRKDPNDPFKYRTMTEDGEDIRIYMMTWRELIDIDRQKLTYMSDTLKVKEQNANDYFHKKYPELVDFKTKSKLTLQKLEKGKNKQLGI